MRNDYYPTLFREPESSFHFLCLNDSSPKISYRRDWRKYTNLMTLTSSNASKCSLLKMWWLQLFKNYIPFTNYYFNNVKHFFGEKKPSNFISKNCIQTDDGAKGFHQKIQSIWNLWWKKTHSSNREVFEVNNINYVTPLSLNAM